MVSFTHISDNGLVFECSSPGNLASPSFLWWPFLGANGLCNESIGSAAIALPRMFSGFADIWLGDASGPDSLDIKDGLN